MNYELKDGVLTMGCRGMRSWKEFRSLGSEGLADDVRRDRRSLLKAGLIGGGLAVGGIGGALLLKPGAMKLAVEEATAAGRAAGRKGVFERLRSRVNFRKAAVESARKAERSAAAADLKEWRGGRGAVRARIAADKVEKAAVKSDARDWSAGRKKWRDGRINRMRVAKKSGVITPSEYSDWLAGTKDSKIGIYLERGGKGRRVKEFLSYEEAGIPLSGQIRRDMYVKRLRDEDIKRGTKNAGLAGIGGAAAGTGLAFHLRKGFVNKRHLLKGAGLGAAVGLAGFGLIRRATKDSRDMYGERQRWAKAAERVPLLAGLGLTGGLALVNRKRIAAHFARRLAAAGAVKYFAGGKDREVRKHGLNPYIGAALSGGASGALVGGVIPAFRRGMGIVPVLKGAAGLGAASAGIVGGGAWLGSKMIGKPRDDERSAFTKRAGIGGALAGAGLGVGGALVLKKTRWGKKMLLKGAKEWRPFHWIEKGGLVKASGIGAVGGALTGLYQGADEGQQVDSIINMRKDIKEDIKDRVKKLERRVRVRRKYFGYGNQPRRADNSTFVNPLEAQVMSYDLKANKDGSVPSFTQAQFAKGYYNQGSRLYKWGGRGRRLITDTGAVLTGQGRARDASGRLKRREWEKAWFRNLAGAAAAGAATMGGVLVTTRTPLGRKYILPRVQAAERWANKKGASLFRMLSDGRIGRRRLRYFDFLANLDGWDIRDARGRSARVFAPGSRRRQRRNAEWHETKEGQKKLLIGAGVLGSLAAAGGTGLAAWKLGGRRATKRAIQIIKRGRRGAYDRMKSAVRSEKIAGDAKAAKAEIDILKKWAAERENVIPLNIASA